MAMTSPRHPALRPVPAWTLGERLRKVRRSIGAGQAEFAEQLDENRKTYASWELDTSTPRNLVAVARRVELLTGYPASWLLGLDEGVAEEPVQPEVTVGRVTTKGSCSTTAGQRLALLRLYEASGSADSTTGRIAS